MNRFAMQDEQYEFPYHYIPSYTNDAFKRGRELGWGGDYLSYMKFIKEKVTESRAKTVLNVGCGDGRLCNILQKTNRFQRIKGIDLSARAIDWAKAFNPSVEFCVMDVAMEKDRWDAVTIVEVIEHIPDNLIIVFFQSLWKVLEDKGRIYLTVPSTNLPLQKKHYRHYDIELIKRHLQESGLNWKIEECGYIVPRRNIFDIAVQKLFYNRIWKFSFYDKFEWKRLWRNGLLASAVTGIHCYAVISKK